METATKKRSHKKKVIPEKEAQEAPEVKIEVIAEKGDPMSLAVNMTRDAFRENFRLIGKLVREKRRELTALEKKSNKILEEISEMKEEVEKLESTWGLTKCAAEKISTSFQLEMEFLYEDDKKKEPEQPELPFKDEEPEVQAEETSPDDPGDAPQGCEEEPEDIPEAEDPLPPDYLPPMN